MMIGKRALRHVTERRNKGDRYIVSERTIFFVFLSRNEGVGEESMERQITMTWAELGAEFSATDASLDKPEHSGPDPEKTGVD
jgi:hypothetical protein